MPIHHFGKNPYAVGFYTPSPKLSSSASTARGSNTKVTTSATSFAHHGGNYGVGVGQGSASVVAKASKGRGVTVTASGGGSGGGEGSSS